MFDGALMLGICDKIVPGLLIASLTFGHLPIVFVPGGPMTTGLPNSEKTRIRQLYAEGKLGRDALLEAESKSYHGPGTCTFYGTANSNQMLMEIMGLHLPGASFVNPYTPLRDALTVAAAKRATEITALGDNYTPISSVIDERSMVNGVIGLLATGGSTNHTMHLVAAGTGGRHPADLAGFLRPVGRRAAAHPDLSERHRRREPFPGGRRHVAADPGLLKAGLLHADVTTITGPGGMERYLDEPFLDNGTLTWRPGPERSLDPKVVATAEKPFSADGGLKMLDGNLGHAVIKISAVKPEHRFVEAPAKVFTDQNQMIDAFKNGELTRDVVAVVTFQGPKANGMPELHKLTPSLGVLQDQGFKVALVTDGRMSGASGKVPAAIHVTPESADGGPLARVRDGDMIRLDAEKGTLEVLVDAATFAAREPLRPDLSGNDYGVGRELFAVFRDAVGDAESGASVFKTPTRR